MNILFFIYVVLTIIAILCLTAATLSVQSARRNPSPRDLYIKQITALLSNDNASQESIRARSSRSRLALAEAIHTVVSHTYGNETDRLRNLIERLQLDHFLMRRILYARGTRRARLLMLMSALPTPNYSSQHFQRYIHSSDSDIRNSALLTIIAINPTSAIQAIASLRYDLSPFDIARILTLLRRGVLPIAYEPLLGNDNRNLRMLGLAIVRTFGIEIAEKRLHNIIISESSHSVISEAIYTLASLGRPLHHARIREYLSSMSEYDRRSLCRHLTVEGYSLGAVKAIFPQAESRYAEGLINSYKRALVRTTATQ